MNNEMELMFSNETIALQNTQVDAETQEYLNHAKAFNTLKAYQSDWEQFATWCAENEYSLLPADPEAVYKYLISLDKQGYKASTLQRRMSSISQVYQATTGETPTNAPIVKNVWQGIQNKSGTRQEGKAPLHIDDIRMMVDTLPETLLGIRDHAMLLLGFAGAFRRSELVGLDIEDIEFTREGLVAHVRKSKTDQKGEGMKKGIPYGSRYETCPVRALKEWIEQSGLTTGPLFRSVNRHGRVQSTRLTDQVVAKVVKRVCEAAGLDPKNYAGHSLRSGLATTAAQAGVSERVIMKQTGHQSVQMVRKYIRDGSLFRDNAAAQIGL